jgi:aminobenzoyl-glutamate utilization protein B
MKLSRCALLFPCVVLIAAPLAAQTAAAPDHKEIIALVNQHSEQYQKVSKQIWDFAELGYHEQKSSGLLQDQLKAAGFTVTTPMPDEPTAFVASFGSGSPVIGILGEFDALPGLSQASVPDRSALVDGAPGHGCGHNLLGSAAALAATALKDYMVANHVKGTLRFYGTPAEEGGSGKVYMLRAGLFKDVDIVLHWHPADRNAVFNGGGLAITSAKFTFHGIAAHAAAAPERGRSALDGVMLMGNGLEFLREHVPSTTRIHYIVTKGGVAPNVVPDLAQMYLMARSPSGDSLAGIWDRILKISQGAALMTETTVDVNIVSSDANVVPNTPLANLAQKELEEVGGFNYTPEEAKYAAELQKSLPPDAAGHLDQPSKIMPLKPYDPNAGGASTDVGDISWQIPTIGFVSATFVPGVAAHTWQATATTGMSIGQEGMLISAKSLALLGADLFAHPDVIVAAKADFAEFRKTHSYTSQIPTGQKPPLNYRDE